LRRSTGKCGYEISNHHDQTHHQTMPEIKPIDDRHPDQGQADASVIITCCSICQIYHQAYHCRDDNGHKINGPDTVFVCRFKKAWGA